MRRAELEELNALCRQHHTALICDEVFSDFTFKGDAYLLWRDQGFLRAVPGKSIHYGFVAQRLAELNAEYNIQSIAYDRWRIDDLKRELDSIGTEIELVPHGQGFKDMAPAIDEAEVIIFDKKIRIHRNPVLTWCSLSAMSDMDPAGGRKFNKRKSTARIDGIQALVMAISNAMRFKEEMIQGEVIFI